MQDLYQPTLPLPSLHSKTGAQKTNPFEIHALEQTIKEGNHAPGIKDWCKIIWIKDGSGAFCLDTHKYAISSNTIYCIKRDQTVKFDPDDRATGYAISFSADFLAVVEDHTESFHHMALFHPLSLFSIIKVGEKQLSEMLEIAKKMVSAYARDLHVTANYLNETVKKASGSPASYHIQQRIILEAKRKARHVRTSMKEIAYGLGFADLAHFSKYFKRASGINFTDFKKELSGQFRFATEF
jgi:AraC family transcriptional activator of pobA